MQPAYFVDVHATEFGSPLVEDGFTDVVPGTNVLDRRQSLSFMQCSQILWKLLSLEKLIPGFDWSCPDRLVSHICKSSHSCPINEIC